VNLKAYGFNRMLTSSYPDSSAARDRWILERRPTRNLLDPQRAYASLVEREPGPSGVPVDSVTIFLTNRECPWRCLMCDLWRNTLEESVPDGAIASQIREELRQFPEIAPERSQLKLYNAGSFFDPRAIPAGEYAEIARLASPFGRTIVECHPAMVGDRCLRFRDLLARPLEVALGLETVHPQVLDRLNKRMSVDQFRSAADFLRTREIDVRVFILLRPPWLSEEEGVQWAKRSLDFAFDCGAAVCSIIPTRAGNGAMEALAAAGEFTPPALSSLETVLEYGLSRGRGRVFADLWNVDVPSQCASCSQARVERIRRMNMAQRITEPVQCMACRPTD
jgi:radical SAM enzyme (TIGR01210 family)